MDHKQAMQARHSVRAYKDTPIAPQTLASLKAYAEECNRESGLNIQIVTDEPRAFDSAMAHYGHFSGVTSYIALIGKKGAELDEKCGYYGEKLVLEAQTLGLNTCWVAMSYKKHPEAYTVNAGEKLALVISLGYGKTPGHSHKSKTPQEVVQGDLAAMPDWFKAGVDAALLAPTAVNQQKFRFGLSGGAVTAKAGLGFYAKVDLGIAKYHFELGAGKENFAWAQSRGFAAERKEMKDERGMSATP